MLATLASLQPFLCHGLRKGWSFADNVRAEDSWHPRRARVFLDIHSHGERARLWPGWPPRACVCGGLMGLWLPTRSPTG